MDKISLSSAIQLFDVNNITVTDFNYTPTSNLREVSISNCTGIDSHSLVKTWVNALNASQNKDELYHIASIRLSGIHWENVDPQLMIDIKKMQNVNITGYVKFTRLNYSLYEQLLQLYGESVFDVNGALRFDGPSMVFLNCPSELSGNTSVQLSTVVVPATTNTVRYRLYNGSTRVQEVDDIATYNGATLNCATGLLTVVQTEVEKQVGITAFVNDQESDPVVVTMKSVIEPNTISIEGSTDIVSNGEYQYSVSPVPTNSTVAIT